MRSVYRSEKQMHNKHKLITQKRDSSMTSSSRDLEVSGKLGAVFSCHSESSQNTFSERHRSNEPGNRGQGDGSPRRTVNRRRRAREGPELACVQTPFPGSGTCRGGRANECAAVVPSSRRGKSSRRGGRTGLPARVSGRHLVRR